MLHALSIQVLCICVAAVVSHPPTTTPVTYDTKFDDVDLTEILGQERLLLNYIKCLEGTGPCTPDGKMLKDTLPDAVINDCARCSEKQRYGSQKVTNYLIDNRPDDWGRLEKIYDPEGNYRKRYLQQKQSTISVNENSDDA